MAFLPKAWISGLTRRFSSLPRLRAGMSRCSGCGRARRPKWVFPGPACARANRGFRPWQGLQAGLQPPHVGSYDGRAREVGPLNMSWIKRLAVPIIERGMRDKLISRAVALLAALVGWAGPVRAGDSPQSPDHEALPMIKPAEPTGTGLLLEPPLDLSGSHLGTSLGLFRRSQWQRGEV